MPNTNLNIAVTIRYIQNDQFFTNGIVLSEDEHKIRVKVDTTSKVIEFHRDTLESFQKFLYISDVFFTIPGVALEEYHTRRRPKPIHF